MQYSSQANAKFRYSWNSYKDNNEKRHRGEDHKQASFFAHSQTASCSSFITDIEIRFNDKTDPSGPTKCEDFWIDTLKTCYFQGLNCFCFFIVFVYLQVTIVFIEMFIFVLLELVCFSRGNS